MSGPVVDSRFPHLGGNASGGDHATFCPALWEWLVEKYRIKYVLDVGCGEGQALVEFKKLGCETIGVDGLFVNIKKCQGPAVVHDLTVSPLLLSECDLVWCCEVVEHIEAEKKGPLLETISQGKILAMTHAVPGQGGYHHVNCQPKEYWINQLTECGMIFSEEDTEAGKLLSPSDNHFGRHGLIFHKGL